MKSDWGGMQMQRDVGGENTSVKYLDKWWEFSQCIPLVTLPYITNLRFFFFKK